MSWNLQDSKLLTYFQILNLRVHSIGGYWFILIYGSDFHIFLWSQPRIYFHFLLNAVLIKMFEFTDLGCYFVFTFLSIFVDTPLHPVCSIEFPMIWLELLKTICLNSAKRVLSWVLHSFLRVLCWFVFILQISTYNSMHVLLIQEYSPRIFTSPSDSDGDTLISHLRVYRSDSCTSSLCFHFCFLKTQFLPRTSKTKPSLKLWFLILCGLTLGNDLESSILS